MSKVLITFRFDATRLEGRVLKETKKELVIWSDLFSQEFILSKRNIKQVKNHG